MDRSILESNPHSVVEGMLIAGYAIGACKGFIYVRAEYPLAVEKFTHAVESAREGGRVYRCVSRRTLSLCWRASAAGLGFSRSTARTFKKHPSASRPV